METLTTRYYEFGEFRLDARRRILLKNGDQIPLSSRIFDLLLVLLQNEGQVLEHDELLDKVWEGMFVEQSNLKKSVSALRHILGEQPNESLFIKTIPRRGYCFVAPVRAVSDDIEEEVLFRRTETEIIVEQIETDDEPGEPTRPKALPSAPVSFVSRYKLPIVAVGILILGSVAFAAWRFLSPRPILFSLENVKIQKLTSDGTIFESSVSPDGNYLVHVTRDHIGVTLNVHQLATGSTSKLASYPNASFWGYQFTPDGNFVYYILKNWEEPDKSGIYKVPFLGGEPKMVYRADGGGSLTFSPDGKRFAFAHTDQNGDPVIITMNVDGTDARPLKSFPGRTRLWSLLFAPDGKGILYCLRREESDQRILYTVGEVALADSSETVIIPEQERVVQVAAWLPDRSSMLLLVREQSAELRHIWQFFPSSNEWRRVTNDDNNYKSINLVRGGTAIVTNRESTTGSIWAAEADPYDFRQVTGGMNRFGHVSWTGDGRLVYLSVENNAEVISIMSAAGRNKQQLTKGNDGMWLQPTVSGDGRSILFVSNRSGSQQIWRMGLEGENPTVLTNSATPIFYGKLLSDNQTLIYQKYTKPKGWMLFKKVGDSDAPVADLSVSYWDISPDEKSVAIWVEDPETKKWKAVIMDLASGAITKTLNIPESRGHLHWMKDGKGVTYLTIKDDVGELKRLPIDGDGPPKTLATVTSEPFSWFDWSSDGRRLAVIRSKNFSDAVMITPNNGAN
jgi:DNA-binding winged helix-turn-helix (wHTH) protein/Tol biopolymer transport system component